MRPLWRAECCTPVSSDLTKVKRMLGWMREGNPPPQRDMAEENTEGRTQVRAKLTIWVFPEALKVQLFLCWHMLDHVQSLFQSDLLISYVPQSTPQLKRNIFLNPKLIYKFSSWLSDNGGKGRMGKYTETKPRNENYICQAENVSSLGFGKPHEVLERWQRQPLGHQGPEWNLWQSQGQSSGVRWWWGQTHPGCRSSAAHGWRVAEHTQLLKGKSAHAFPTVQM